MSDINVVTISGRLTRDPEMRGSEKNVAAFSVASNRSYRKGESEEWQEEVTFVDATAFNQLAERVGNKLSKGSFITVTGRLELNKYQAADGTNRQQLRLIAQNIVSPAFLMPGKAAETADEDVPEQETLPETTEDGEDLPF